MKNLIKKNIVTIILIFSALNLFSQPTIQWQKNYGAENDDYPYSVIQLTNGDYLFAGATKSATHEIDTLHGDLSWIDVWIVKTDQNGNIIWTQTYGGTADDYATQIIQTSDGGYAFCGASRSSDYEVTGHHGSNSYFDYWVVKIDSLGHLLWEKSFGGDGDDVANSIKQTYDGGYIVAGYSNSTNGDVVGNHGGSKDYWIIRLDGSGNLIWSKSLGGSQTDVANSIIQARDSSYVVTGYTFSNDGDVTGNHGSGDFWTVKLDTGGAVIWKKSYGGAKSDEAFSVIQSSDNGFVVGGFTNSTDGNITSNHGGSDYWLVKLNASGNLIWQKTYGGSDNDQAYSLIQIENGNFVLGGYSRSIDGDVTGNHGEYDYWLMETDGTGQLVWQKSFGGNGVDEARCLIRTADFCFMIVGATESTTSGDVGVNLSDTALSVFFDYWAVKTNCQGINPFITANGPVHFCPGNSVILDAGVFPTYNWSNGSTNETITVTTSGNYIVTVTNGNGCSGTASQSVIVSPAPTITANGFTIFCQEGSVTLTSSIGVSYLWSNSSTTQSINVTTSGNYSVTITDSLGCILNSSITQVTVNPTPIASFTTNVSSGCAPLTVYFTNTSTYDTTYLWDLGDNHSTNYINPIHTYSAGTFIVKLTVFSDQGCFDTVSHTITVYPSPAPTITPGGPTHFCPGNSVILDAGVFPTYNWSNGSTTETITANTSGNYVVTVTSGNGCTGTASQTVLVSTAPTITANGPITFCMGGSVTLTSSIGVSYIWSNSSTIQSINVTTSGNYSVTVTDSLGCILPSSNTQVTVNPLPVASFTTDVNSGCAPLTVYFTNTSTNDSTYLWDLGDNHTTNYINPIHIYSAGTFIVKLTVFSNQGCFDTVSHTITVYPTPTPTISANGPTHFCPGNSVVLDAGVYTSYIWSNGSTNETIIVNASGNYIVTVTNSNGCTGTASQIVTVNTGPSITAGGPTTFCLGGSVTLYSSIGVSYHWNNGGTTDSITVTTAGNYSITVTDTLGCSIGSNFITVTTLPLPTASFTMNVNSGCVSLTDTFTNTSINAVSYLWDFGDNFSSNYISPIHTYTSAGTYIVKLTVFSSQGCFDSISHIVTVYPLPTPTITPNGPTHFCPGNSVVLDAGVYSSYSWSNGATTETITVNTSGNYVVTVTNSNGCIGTASQVVTVNTAPTITSSGPTTFCIGGSVTLFSSTGVSYLWSTGSTIDSIIINTGGNYSVTVTDTFGCSIGSNVITVTILPLPTASFTPDVYSGCTSLTDTFTNNSINAVSYLWDFGDNFSSNYISPIHTYTNAGTYIVKLVVFSSQGCIDSVSHTITVYSLPTPTITANGPTHFCPGSSVVLDAGVYSFYNWSNGSSTETITTDTSGNYIVTVTNSNGCTGTATQTTIVNSVPTISHTGPLSFCQGGNDTLIASSGVSYLWSTGATTKRIIITTSGNYSVTVTDTLGCVTASLVSVVTVNPLPTASFTTNFSSGCAPLIVTFTNTSTGGTTYLWDFGDNTSSNFPNPIHSYNAGTYSVKLTVLNSFGCYDTALAIITVITSPNPIITANGPTHFCPGNSVVLDAGVFPSYSWNTGSTSETITVDTSGNYIVTVTIGNGCTGTASQSVIVSSIPVILHNGPTSFCFGGSIILHSTPAVSYLWSTGATIDSITVIDSGNYSVTITDTLGCILTSAITHITVNPIPTASFTTDVTSGCAPLTVSFTNTSTGGTSYLWDFGDNTSTNYINPVHNYIDTGTYTVKLTTLNSFGCFDTAVQNITVIPSPVPIITPNGPTNFCNNVSVSLDAGNYVSYVWNNGSTSETIAVTATGNYTVTVTAGNGCTGSASQLIIGDTCGAIQCVSIYPFQCGMVNSYYPDTNYYGFDNFIANAWTIAGNPSIDRSLMQFDFSNIPNIAILDSANLNLFWHSSPNGGHSNLTGSNACWLQRVTSSWNPNSVTWNTQPNSTNINNVVLPASTFSTENYPDINILSMVNDMISTSNHGLMMQLQTEVYYRALIFASIYNIDSTVYPTLNICYHIPIQITTGAVTLTHCSGAIINVPYTVANNFNAGNIFTAQLSDSAGSFANPVNIGSLTSITSGIISATIPQLTPYGNHYRIRVIASNLAAIGSNNGSDITIYDPIPTIIANPSSSICQGMSATLDAGVYSSYHWSTSSANETITVSATGNYAVTVTDSHGCTASGSDSVTVHPIPNVSISPPDTIVCENSSAYTLHGGNPTNGVYTGTGVSNGTFNPAITGLGTFTIMYTYTDSAGCSDSASQLIHVDICNGIPNLSEINSINISPTVACP